MSTYIAHRTALGQQITDHATGCNVDVYIHVFQEFEDGYSHAVVVQGCSKIADRS